MSARWPKTLMALHWLVAALLGGLVVVGFRLADLPDGDASRLWPGRLHSATGMVVGALMLARLVVRRRGPAPEPLPMPTLHRRGVGAVHGALYVTVLAMVVSGMAMALGSDWGAFVRGDLAVPPKLAGLWVREGHELVGFGVLGLVAAHVVGVLVQQVRKGGTLRRMVPFLR